MTDASVVSPSMIHQGFLDELRGSVDRVVFTVLLFVGELRPRRTYWPGLTTMLSPKNGSLADYLRKT